MTAEEELHSDTLVLNSRQFSLSVTSFYQAIKEPLIQGFALKPWFMSRYLAFLTFLCAPHENSGNPRRLDSHKLWHLFTGCTFSSSLICLLCLCVVLRFQSLVCRGLVSVSRSPEKSIRSVALSLWIVPALRGQMILSHRSHIRESAYQIFTL